MELNTVYFYTVAIHEWEHLLKPDKFKQIVLDSLVYLVEKKKLKVYGFVIMPNHVHIIWENIEMNGREMSHTSFMKFTGHAFLKELEKTDLILLDRFKVYKNSREHQFWRRDSLPIIIHSKKMLEQKLEYIHLNPLQEHWQLVVDPNDYFFSSSSFYERNDTRFSWLADYRGRF